jgi:chromosome segregation ATPase
MTQTGGGWESGFSLIGQGLGQILGNAIAASTPWQALMHNVRSIRTQVHDIRRSLMALTTAQQAAINELSEGINTLSENLGEVLEAARDTKTQLQDALDSLGALQIEEAREQALREQLEAAMAQLDTDVVQALTPLAAQINAMNDSLQTPEDQGGSPITPGQPTEPATPTEPAAPPAEPPSV